MSDDNPLQLYPFRKQDPLTLKWHRARWKASLEEIEANGWKVNGPAMTVPRLGHTSGFMRREDPRPLPPQPALAVPHASDGERRLARLFLRRYVTYCARRGQQRRARGAEVLWAELA